MLIAKAANPANPANVSPGRREALSRPTVRAWRDAAVRGDDLDQRLRLATEAYVAAGGAEAGAREQVEGILRAGAR